MIDTKSRLFPHRQKDDLYSLCSAEQSSSHWAALLLHRFCRQRHGEVGQTGRWHWHWQATGRLTRSPCRSLLPTYMPLTELFWCMPSKSFFPLSWRREQRSAETKPLSSTTNSIRYSRLRKSLVFPQAFPFDINSGSEDKCSNNALDMWLSKICVRIWVLEAHSVVEKLLWSADFPLYLESLEGAMWSVLRWIWFTVFKSNESEVCNYGWSVPLQARSGETKNGVGSNLD